ncbi:WD40 repeat-like protein [Rhodotorula sp. JG-1b]|nr:WD40 repeat-like protein [Rhodotorula sp. JG-1b]
MSAQEGLGEQVQPLYISAACSRSNSSAARPQDGLVAFASGHLIALWKSANELSAGVHRTLPGHKGDVTALDFVQGSGKSRYLVSGDATGAVKVWKEHEEQWTLLATLTGHQGSVSAVIGLQLSGDDDSTTDDLLILSGGSDSTIRISRVSESSQQFTQTLSTNGKIPLAFALTNLPSSCGLLLAVGGTEQRIHLYSAADSDHHHTFARSLSLEGHTDWVRCLSFTTPIPANGSSSSASTSTAYDIAPGEVLLASGSQDNYIRLWRVTKRDLATEQTAPQEEEDAPLDELDAALAAVEDQAELRVKAHDFTVDGEGHFSCASEAVLLGHDAWVTGLNWAPAGSSRLELLSASADRSMILWTPVSAGMAALPESSSTRPSSSVAASHAHASIWTSQHRFGEFTSSTNLGFFGALWGLGGRTVLANGWGGSWHVWRQEVEEEEGEVERQEWRPQVATTGHLGAVKQVVWEGKGEYLLSASQDMSARLHAPWRRTVNGKAVETWHELGRPQIHGYPLASVAFTSPEKRLQFVSGADEKIVRVFDAPKLWVQTLKTLSGVDAGDAASRPMAANIPPLGLSNRAVASPDEAAQLAPASTDVFDEILPVNFTVSDHPPFEEQLLGSMLWPEVDKLYGHPFELVSVTSAHSLPIIATACKATAPEHALIRVYSTETWQPVGVPLEGHSLTITKLAFSPPTLQGADADRWLLSVSRDRTWNVYERASADGEEPTYRRAAIAKSHARIIWDACWSGDATFFATASRDKTVKIWSTGDWQCLATLNFAEAATSVASALSLDKSRHILAVGLENGEIHLFYAMSGETSSWKPLLQLDSQ